MPWPSTTAYNDAIQNLRTSVSDEELRAGELARTSRGLPMLWSGNFADVYKVHCPATGNTWAVKCFTRQSPGLRDRYRQISDHLQRARLPFMVDFEFVEPGILAGGRWHPFLKMRWVEGLTLNQFVSEYVENRRTLELLLPMWKRLSQMLREAEIAHCDLQHGNVLLVPAGERGQLSLKLIDYDGMYVPSLGGRKPGELGHPAYQHPQRFRMGVYNAEVDRFSHLAIYSAVRCLTVGRRELWTRFDNGDNLLFREVDFLSPGKSEVFHQLWALRDEDARALVGHLILATQTPLHRVRLLDEVVSNGTVRRLNRHEQRQVKAMLGRGAKQVRAAPQFKRGGIDLGAESGVPLLAGTPGGQTAGLVPGQTPAGKEQSPSPDGPTPLVPTRDQAAPSTTAPTPTPRRLRVAALFGWVIWAGLMPVRRIDQLLGLAVGGKNNILHNFLRAVAMTCVVVGAAILIGWVTSHVRPPPEAPRIAEKTPVSKPQPPEPKPEKPPVEQSDRERALAALMAAQDAEQAADAVFQTAVRPASYHEGQQLLADADTAMEEESFDLAKQLFDRAAELFAKAQIEAPAADQQGEAEEAWTAALAAADEDLLRDYAPQGFADAREKAASAETQAASGKAQQAAALYRDALAALNRATTEAALFGQLKGEIARNDRVAAADLLARLEKLIPGDPRLDALREKVEGLSPPLAVAPFSEVEAREYQQQWSRYLGTPVNETNSIGMKFVLIPPGEAPMSSPESGQQRPLPISRPFYLGVCEVTQDEYQQVVGRNPSAFKQSGGNAPVEMVSWEDAGKFCAILSARAREGAAGRRYRLPSEVEWEYACRAGTTTYRWFGDDGNILKILGDYAWHVGNSMNTTHPVAQKQPNAWGLYDVYGNVWEWCADSDQMGPDVSGRMLRGGSYLDSWVDCSSAVRRRGIQARGTPSYGFRVAFDQQAHASVGDVAEEKAEAVPGDVQGLPETVELAGAQVTTADGVQLAATFYPGPKSRNTVPVILLHTWKGSRHDYRGLATYLQRQGHAVLVPDLRGHGGSTQSVFGAGPLHADKLSAEDFRLMLHDVEALRKFLAQKNDQGDLNLSTLCIVGAEMGAAVAGYYAYYDWTQSRREGSRMGPSQDVKRLVLISPERFKGMLLTKPLSHPVIRRQMSVMIIAGNEHSRSLADARQVYNTLDRYSTDRLGPGAQQRDLVLLQPSTKLGGTHMLGVPELNLEEQIANFIQPSEFKLGWGQHSLYPWYKRGAW